MKYLIKKIKEKDLVDKSDISGFIDNSDLDKKIVKLATKAELKSEQAKIVKFKAFDSSYFEDDGTQNYLVFQPIFKHFKMAISANTVTARKSKGLFDENIKPPWTSDNSLNLVIGGIDNAKTLVKFDGVCLKQDKVTFTPKAALNFYIIYEVNLWPLNLDSKFA